MRVDFYQLGRDPAPAAAAMIAGKALAAGERLLVVAESAEQRKAIAEALWRKPGAFLANGIAGEGHEERQPVLISPRAEAANGARMCLIADGEWRDLGDGFARVFLLFGAEQVEAARACWRWLGEAGLAERHIWKQDARGAWREGA